MACAHMNFCGRQSSQIKLRTWGKVLKHVVADGIELSAGFSCVRERAFAGVGACSCVSACESFVCGRPFISTEFRDQGTHATLTRSVSCRKEKCRFELVEP